MTTSSNYIMSCADVDDQDYLSYNEERHSIIGGAYGLCCDWPENPIASQREADDAGGAGRSCECFGIVLGHIERGTRVPSLETIVAIAEALEIAVDDLLPLKRTATFIPGADIDAAKKLLLLAVELAHNK